MKITIIGTGYVGLVSGTCFAEMGNDVTCIDVNADKINNLNNGILPIYEPGLEELYVRNFKNGNLKFSTSLKDNLSGDRLIFSCVGTPQDVDGSADLKYVLGAARDVGKYIVDDGYKLFVTKSTVPVGTANKVRAAIAQEVEARGVNVNFGVASNPEFLKEGAAVKDFMFPERVVIGVDCAAAEKALKKLYKPFSLISSDNLIVTDIPSAEMIKYAANSMLATRISFMNEIANLCEKVGANVDMVRKGMGTDSRIGPKFLYAGCGYGGSCFPKDVRALIKTGEENNVNMSVLKSVVDANEFQKHVLFTKLSKIYNDNNLDINGSTVAIWGLAFKPQTDDMREAPSLVIIDELVNAGANVVVYDPIAMNECRHLIGDKVKYTDNKYDCLNNVDALVIVTEWNEFRACDLFEVKKRMNHPFIVDGRNILNVDDVRNEGFVYSKIG